MKKVNIHEAKTHLSRLVEEAAKGKPFIIGFLEGQMKIPDDFNTMFQSEIERMFYGDDE
jgi:hypothetical protein